MVSMHLLTWYAMIRIMFIHLPLLLIIVNEEYYEEEGIGKMNDVMLLYGYSVY